MRKTPLKRGDKPLARRTELARGPGPERRTEIRKRNVERHEKEWAKQFHSPEFVEFTRDEPCVCRGKGAAWGCKGGPCQTSHDPSRGAGGTWKNTHPASAECHAKIGQGAETFWRLIERTREEANRAHHMAWLERQAP